MAPNRITNPTGITVDGELVYIVQSEGGKLNVIDCKSGNQVCSLSSIDGTSGLWCVAVDRDGFIYVCDVNNKQLIIF